MSTEMDVSDMVVSTCRPEEREAYITRPEVCLHRGRLDVPATGTNLGEVNASIGAGDMAWQTTPKEP